MKKRAKTTKSVTTSPKAAKRTPAAKSQTVAPKRPKKPVSASKSATTTQTSGRMTLAEVMGILESLGSEQTRRTWTRHGAPEPMFGVLFGELYKLMKRIDVDHELAQKLWATGNVDARNLAMKIADPALMTPAELTQWAIENPMRMCNLYIATLAAEGPHARVLLKDWLSSSNALLLASGWTLLGRLSDLDPSFSEQELLRGIGDGVEVHEMDVTVVVEAIGELRARHAARVRRQLAQEVAALLALFPFFFQALFPVGGALIAILGQEFLQPVNVINAVLHIGVTHQRAEERQSGVDAVDDEFVERTAQAHQRFRTVAAMHDQFADQRVIVS